MRLLKFLIAIFLVPACLGTIAGLMSQVFSLGGSHYLVYFIAGFMIYVIIQKIFSLPLRTYILGHELTHAIWSLAFGGKVKKITVSKTKGEVLVTKVNFLITLAPYFFPFYTFLILILYYSINFFHNIEYFFPILVFLIGFTWSFHLILCFYSLKKEQPDIQRSGIFFSTVIVWLMNIIVLSLILNLTMSDNFSLREFFQVTYVTSKEIFVWVFSKARQIIAVIIPKLQNTLSIN